MFYCNLEVFVIPSLQNSLSMELEELEQDNQISLSVERRRGSFGRLTVHWAANGSLADIYPTSGVVSNTSSVIHKTHDVLTTCYEFNVI